MCYAVAYCNKNGEGKSKVEPFFQNAGIDCFLDACLCAYMLKQKGFQNVTVIGYEESEAPELITWSFVKAHRIEMDIDIR